MDVGSGSLQNCQGGSLQPTGTKRAELIATTTDGEEVLLQHEFIVGNLTSCLVSLGQLYQGGWTIHKDDNSNRLSLQSPGNEISIPVEYKNRSFAIKAHVRQRYIRDGRHLHRWPNHQSNKSGQEDQQSMGC